MLSRMVDQAKAYRRILAHPLNTGGKLAATKRWLAWHVGSRLVPGPVAVPFVNDTMLLTSPGMTGATENLYNGMAEFADMAFLLHFLRPDHLFLDVGANVGVYTVLASAAAGARAIAVEPLPATYQRLRRNVALNQVDARVETLNVAVGEQHGTARFTQDYDATNHIVAAGESARCCEVPVRTVDEIVAARTPELIKVDIEGYELPALEGAKSTLSNPRLRAIVIELNGSAVRYGFSEDRIVQLLVGLGFRPVAYEPFTRTLREADALPTRGNNSIFVRDLAAMQSQLKAAPTYRVSTGQTL
jgi:FkbM family methyltransferase